MKNTIYTTVTKSKTLRIRPEWFGLPIAGRFELSTTRKGNYSLVSGTGTRELQNDGRLEFSVADRNMWPYETVEVSKVRTRDGGVSFKINRV